jgi:hypothetical protein
VIPRFECSLLSQNCPRHRCLYELLLEDALILVILFLGSSQHDIILKPSDCYCRVFPAMSQIGIERCAFCAGATGRVGLGRGQVVANKCVGAGYRVPTRQSTISVSPCRGLR